MSAADLKVRVQTEPFDPGAELNAFLKDTREAGGIAVFVGQMRDFKGPDRATGEAVSAMTLEHYPGMTEKAIGEIVAQARARWQVIDALVIHRVGTLRPADPIVLVAVASAHRGDAFAACEFIMDYLKTRAPFWKKEQSDAGPRWVEARESDDLAAERWRLKG